MLTAFRRWKRLASTVVERKQEIKKEAMRNAYYTTSSAVKKRTTKQAFHHWKKRYDTRLADNVRSRHLQAGALALWQMRYSHTKQLATRERIVTTKRDHLTLTQAWYRWAERAEQAKAVNHFQHHHSRLLASRALHSWRKAAMLSKLSTAYAERRLKVAAFDGWKKAIEQQQIRRRNEALAQRWRARRMKQNAMSVWRRRQERISSMEEAAYQMYHTNTEERLHSTFHRWQLQSRAALLERVNTSAIAERAFYHWKHRHATLVTSLQQRESIIVHRRHTTTVSACFQRWRHLAKQIRDREAGTQARRNEVVCNDFFITWRNKQLQHRLLQEKSEAVSDFFVLRSTFRQWRTQLQDRRANVKEAHHNKRLAQQVFEIWRTRTAKQRHLADLLQHSLAKSDETLREPTSAVGDQNHRST